MSLRKTRISRITRWQPLEQLWKSKEYAPYYFLFPFVVLFLIFFAYPIVWAIWLSLHSFTFVDSDFVGFAHYARILSGQGFFSTALLITIIISAITIPVQVVGGLFIALLLDSGYAKFRRVMRTAYLLPIMVSMTVIAMVLHFMFENFGMINLALERLFSITVPWLTSPRWAQFSVAMTQAFRWTGFFAILYLAGLQNIPQHLYQAAKIDGASELQQWRYVTIPQLRPIIALVMMIATTRSVRMFDAPFILTAGGPGRHTTTVIIYIYRQAFEQVNLGFASAMAVVFAILLGGLLYLQNKYGERSP